MRKKIVAGNWKMNLSLDEALALANELKVIINHHNKQAHSRDVSRLPEVVLFPPYVYLTKVHDVFVHDGSISVGAQNCHHADKGAFTGEVSASMIRSTGATHVLIGHSERRTYFNEDDALLSQKLKGALGQGLVPIYCCGESLEDRESNTFKQIVTDQLVKGLFWLDKDTIKSVVIAYEPVWAIGTGLTATAEQAQEMHQHIRQLLAEKYGHDTAEQIRILYGGSCNAKNAAELFAGKDVDGGLIGGASLKAHDFFGIISSACS